MQGSTNERVQNKIKCLSLQIKISEFNLKILEFNLKLLEYPWPVRLTSGYPKRSSAPNITYVLQNDPEWKGAIGYDVFAGRIVIVRDCPAGKKGDVWGCLHDKRLSDAFEIKYRLSPWKGAIQTSLYLVAQHVNGTHQ